MISPIPALTPERPMSGAAIRPESEIEQKLGYRFRDNSLLERALTHKSASLEHNERLEFLGDAVLGSFVSECLYRGCGGGDEGVLSRVRAALVNWQVLAQAGAELGIAPIIRVSQTLGRAGERIVADVAEALVGAAYLDGGAHGAEAVIRALIGARLEHAIADPRRAIVTDPKMRLQINLQKRRLPLPSYRLLSHVDSGLSHSFEVACLVEGHLTAKGRGITVKDAERAAARQFMRAYAW